MANFTLSTSQLTGGGGTVSVTPVSNTVFTGRKATGTVTIKNGTATKTVSLSKDYPQFDRITSVLLGVTPVTDWREFNIPSTNTVITITSEANRGTIELYSGEPVEGTTCSVKIGNKYYNASGAESSTEVFFPIHGEITTLTLPNNIGLSSKYTVKVLVKIPQNPKSYSRSGDIYVDTDSISFIQAGSAPTLSATPSSLTWTTAETSAKTITVSSNGSTIPVTVA